MFYKIRREFKHRKKFLKKECFYLYLKSLYFNLRLPIVLRKVIFLKMSRVYFGLMFKNFCILTFRMRAVFSIFRLSRVVLRERIRFGELIGVKKTVK